MTSIARVLVVDDNDEIREGVGSLLREHGYEVLDACDGAQGLLLLRRRERVDLVILDLMMPVMNGATFRWQQRFDPAIAAIPVLILSSVVDGKKAAEMLAAQGHLQKPFAAAALIAEVERLTTRVKRRKYGT